MEARRFWHSHQVELFQGQAPELTELSLQGVPIYWNSSIFRDLRSISIRSIVSSGPTVEEVFQWIASSPRLESFHLCGSTLSPGTVRQDILPVEMPYLKSLQLSQLLTSSTESILSRIRAPPLRKLVVQPAQAFATWAHWPTFFDASLLHFSPTIVSSITHAQSLAISIYAPRARICVSTVQESDWNEGIKIDFDHPQGCSGLQSCLEPLLRNVPVCPQISLTIMALMNVPETDLLWILDSEVNDKVTEISIRNPADDSFLAFLCKARDQAGISKWPFPKLKRLLLPFSTDTSVERLASPLKERYAPDLGELSAALTSDPQPPLILEAPDRLSFLSVANTTFNRSEYDLLSNIVGPDVLQAPVREDDDLSDGSENTLN
ncbi:hypothetical protein FRC01_014395 [Tulasnella sp. 417]|nr:hypothetical protein FRC01_014395 [Tulasnella sp. 417]